MGLALQPRSLQPPGGEVSPQSAAFPLQKDELALTRALPTLDPMEEDILQVVKYCTDLIEEKDLEKLDLVIKYMKR